MELHNSLQYRRAISPDEGAGSDTAKVSQIIDMQGYKSLEFVIATGTLADTDATFTALVEHGDDASLTDNAAVADADLLGVEAEATGAGFLFSDDNVIERIGYKGSKRYVRLTLTPANNTGAWDICAIAVLGNPDVQPQTINV